MELTDCESLVFDEQNDKESLPVVVEKPEFTSGVDFILSPVSPCGELDDTKPLPVLKFFPKIESEEPTEQGINAELQADLKPAITVEPEDAVEEVTEVITEPEIVHDQEIQCNEQSC